MNLEENTRLRTNAKGNPGSGNSDVMDTTDKYKNNIAPMTEDDEALSWTAENDGETWAVFGTRKQMEAEKVADAKKVVEETLKYYTATNSTTKQESEPEPEENEDDLKQCSVLEEYDGNILSKLIDKVYIYNDGNLQVVFKNDNYFRMVCEEGIG